MRLIESDPGAVSVQRVNEALRIRALARVSLRPTIRLIMSSEIATPAGTVVIVVAFQLEVRSGWIRPASFAGRRPGLLLLMNLPAGPRPRRNRLSRTGFAMRTRLRLGTPVLGAGVCRTRN